MSLIVPLLALHSVETAKFDSRCWSPQINCQRHWFYLKESTVGESIMLILLISSVNQFRLVRSRPNSPTLLLPLEGRIILQQQGRACDITDFIVENKEPSSTTASRHRACDSATLYWRTEMQWVIILRSFKQDWNPFAKQVAAIAGWFWNSNFPNHSD